MRLSRPVASGVMTLLLVVVLWLVLRAVGGDAPSGSAPTGGETSASETSPAFGGPLPAGPTTYPEEEGEQGPTGTDTRDWDDVDACDDADLPPELGATADDVVAGGPFDHPGKDGSTFNNYEGYLPDEPRGYYREYTVETPGLDHRGTRRIVTGGAQTDLEVWYYTDDHYASFCEFVP